MKCTDLKKRKEKQKTKKKRKKERKLNMCLGILTNQNPVLGTILDCVAYAGAGEIQRYIFYDKASDFKFHSVNIS